MVVLTAALPKKKRCMLLDSSHAFSTQRERDGESNLMHFRARSYDPRIGRFGAKDPIVARISRHHYVYAGNSPTSRTDPLGLQDRQLRPESIRTFRVVASSKTEPPKIEPKTLFATAQFHIEFEVDLAEGVDKRRVAFIQQYKYVKNTRLGKEAKGPQGEDIGSVYTDLGSAIKLRAALKSPDAKTREDTERLLKTGVYPSVKHLDNPAKTGTEDHPEFSLNLVQDPVDEREVELTMFVVEVDPATGRVLQKLKQLTWTIAAKTKAQFEAPNPFERYEITPKGSEDASGGVDLNFAPDVEGVLLEHAKEKIIKKQLEGQQR